LREKLKSLSELQRVDLEVMSLRKAAEVYPRQLGELEKELQSARSALEAERSRLSDLERQKAGLEQNIIEEKDKVKKWEARLTEQRSTREYAALAREIDIAKKANQTMAEEVVELGRQLAAQRDAVKAKEQELAARMDHIGGQMAALKMKLGELDGQFAQLEQKRAGLAAQVDPLLLRRYDTVRRKRMPVLVPIQAPGTCQGCNMNVPPQLYSMLRSSLGTDVCPSCHRMIYAAEALEAPAEK
jgi:uncharacterized protein